MYLASTVGQKLCQMLEIQLGQRDWCCFTKTSEPSNNTNNPSVVVGSTGCFPCGGLQTGRVNWASDIWGVREPFQRNYHLTWSLKNTHKSARNTWGVSGRSSSISNGSAGKTGRGQVWLDRENVHVVEVGRGVGTWGGAVWVGKKWDLNHKKGQDQLQPGKLK